MTRVEAEAHEHASFLDSQIFGILKNGLGSKKKSISTVLFLALQGQSKKVGRVISQNKLFWSHLFLSTFILLAAEAARLITCLVTLQPRSRDSPTPNKKP